MAPLLMHSLAEFRELIFRCLDLVEARSIVEVGAEDGTFTQELLDWAREHGGAVSAIEPFPTAAMRHLDASWPELHLIEGHSPGALDHLEPADAYLIDGDHNYTTVRGELEALYGAGKATTAVVFLHDVGWPSGRRDMYYDPESLPPGAAHPHTFAKGVVPGSHEVVEGGFRGAGQFAWARKEGGPDNGVLTAVEDFLREHQGELSFVMVPCVFGLGVVYPTTAPWAPELAAILAPYDGNDLLHRLEQNRLSLYLTVLELQDELAVTKQCEEQLRLERRDIDTENRALWARLAELEEAVGEPPETRHAGVEALRDEVETLVRSRAFAAVEVLSRGKRLASGSGEGISRRRLEEVLAASELS